MKINNKIDLIDSEQLAKDWLDLQRLREKSPELFGLKSTGLKTLDEILGGGIELGQLVYIGGKEKSGKTTLLTTIATAWGEQKMNFIFLSGEMTNMQTGNMLFSNFSSVDRTTIRSIKINALEWTSLTEAGKRISQLSGYWGYGFSTISDIDMVINKVEEITKKPIDGIIIDYIQLMEMEKRSGNRVQEIEYFSRSLKRRSISRGKPMAVVVATQLNRTSIRSKLFDAQAFLGSGSLERDMDIGMIVHDVETPLSVIGTKTNKKKITIVGSRETATDSIEVYYDGAKARMKDLFIGAAVNLYDKYWSSHEENSNS